MITASRTTRVRGPGAVRVRGLGYGGWPTSSAARGLARACAAVGGAGSRPLLDRLSGANRRVNEKVSLSTRREGELGRVSCRIEGKLGHVSYRREGGPRSSLCCPTEAGRSLGHRRDRRASLALSLAALMPRPLPSTRMPSRPFSSSTTRSRAPPVTSGVGTGRDALHKATANASSTDDVAANASAAVAPSPDAPLLAWYAARQVPASQSKACAHFIARLEDALSADSAMWLGLKTTPPPRIRVATLGSRVCGTAHVASDLDLCVLDPMRPRGVTPDVCYAEERLWRGTKTSGPRRHVPRSLSDVALPPLYDVTALQRALVDLGCTDVTVAPTPLVPLVRFTHTIAGAPLAGELSVNELLSVENTHLLNAYFALCPPLRVVAALVSAWAEARGLKQHTRELAVRTFNSFSVNLLLIAFCQSTRLLPNLQHPNAVKALPPRPLHTWRSLVIERDGTRMVVLHFGTHDARFVKDAPPVAPPPSLSGLLTDFFAFYAHFNGMYRAVSVRRGGFFARVRAAQHRTEFFGARPHEFVIQDPFQEDRNISAQVVTPGQVLFYHECIRAQAILERDPGDISTLLEPATGDELGYTIALNFAKLDGKRLGGARVHPNKAVANANEGEGEGQ